jgi:hypothetical protein
MHDREAPGPGKGIGIAYCVILFAYWEYISHVDLSPDSQDTHLWIFWTLVFLGLLTSAAVAGARQRS